MAQDPLTQYGNRPMVTLTVNAVNYDEIQCFSVAFVVRDWAGAPKADGVEGSEVRFWPMDALPENLVAIHARTIVDFRQYHGGFMLPNSLEQAERNDL